MLCLFSSFFFILILPVNFLFIIIIIFPFFLFFYTSCTLFRTNKPPHPQCRRIILEYEGALYRVEVEYGARWASGSERWLRLATGRFPAGFESHCGKLFTLEFTFTPLCQCLSEEALSKSCRPLLYRVSKPNHLDYLSQVTYVPSHLCRNQWTAMSQNKIVTNRPSTKQIVTNHPYMLVHISPFL